MRKPLIGIVSNHCTKRAKKPAYRLLDNVVEAVEKTGGLAVILPYQTEAISELLGRIDGFLFPGGDISHGQEFYEQGHKPCWPTSRRAQFEIALMRAAMIKDKPILGICLGMQIMGCLMGGRLRVLPKQTFGLKPSMHRQEDGRRLVHEINIKPDTRLSRIIGTKRLSVNSIHSEEIVAIEPSYISAYANDGVIEGIEDPAKTFMLGVQWHPEYFICENTPHLQILKAFIQACDTHT